jgi:hypothetical protein
MSKKKMWFVRVHCEEVFTTKDTKRSRREIFSLNEIKVTVPGYLL